MIPKQMRRFVDRLFEATGDGEIQWKAGADDAYFAVQKDANLHIRYVFDGDTGESAYTFRITRAETEPFFIVTSAEGDYELMRNLYAAISVNAAGGDSIVDDLFD